MKLDDQTLRALIDFEDSVGVLSVYVGYPPDRAADPQPTAPIEIRNQIKALLLQLRDRQPDQAAAVEQRLDRLGDELGGILDPKAHGRGRVLFVGVGEGRSESLHLQIPFQERVVYRERAYIRPLVAANDEGRAAGILVVNRQGIRILEWSLGEVDELERRDFELTDAQTADVPSGPSPAAPQIQGRGVTHRETYEDRVDDNRHRFLKSAVDDAATLAGRRGWDRVVVAGPPKIRDQVRDAFADGLRVVTAEQAWEEASPHDIAGQAWPLLRSVHRERELALVDQVRDRALSGGAGALGLDPTLDALNEGRVAHLLYRSDVEVAGYVSDAGTLHADDGDPAARATGLRPEPLLVERMVEKAITTSAIVTPVEDDASAGIDEYGSVAALLRW